MAELVGGALLSASLQVLFDRMASRDVVNFIRGKKLNDELLRKLKIKLLYVSAVINDAEEKQFTSPLVKEWLHELEDAVNVAEDLLDEIATEALRCKLEAESGSQVRNLFSTSLNLFDREIEPKIEEILDRLEYIAKEKDVLGLKEGIGEKVSKRTPTTSLVEESDVYGRHDDRDAIINLLLSDDVGDSKIGVMSIVGMGGIGKTTLAQLVYNDDRVKEHFDHFQAWVCVSEDFDVLRITKTVLEAFSSHSCDIKDLNLLQLKLKEELMGKKFLLVLDDLWNENYSDWETLRSPLNSGAQGSKVIVTTRSDNVASVVRANSIYHLNLLVDEDCWSLFAKHAFENKSFGARRNLEVIGKDIVKKCKGLPLALKTLGSLLRFNLDVEEWNKILKSEIWELSDDKSKILPALRLSYHYLPSRLKRCFVYCSIFPKDCELEKEQLIQLWMAEGFLDSSKRNKRMEEIGDEYFDELVSRSFFQRSSSENFLFVMHDLVNDLAKFLAGERCFRMEDDDAHRISEKARHLSYVMSDHSWKLEIVSNTKHLRTFLPLNLKGPSRSYILSNRASLEVEQLLKLRCLRVLCLSNCRNFSELPDSIGTLRHLRYLDLSFTLIKRLPESVTKLYNLQTLKVSNCENLRNLPMDMHKLINLRYLNVYGSNLEEMPAHISKLKCLQMLSTFIVEKENGIKISELGKLPNLRTLWINKLRNVEDVKDSLEAKLKDKNYLEELKLEWGNGNTNDTKRERDMLENLVPHTNLKNLYIHDYMGTRFPDWLGDHSFCNMVSLSLQNCKNCYILPPLGQLPSLKDLSIGGFDTVQVVGPEIYGNRSFVTKPFPSLEKLSFDKMSAWQEWCYFGVEDEEGIAFPCLQELRICNCPNLIGSLPKRLPSLRKLVIIDCEQLISLLQNAPAICELDLTKCEKVGLQQEFLCLVHSLTIKEWCTDVESLLESMTHNDSCLQYLVIYNCSSFLSLPLGCLPTTLKTLKIMGLEKLEFLMQQYHTSLEWLVIVNSCDTFISEGSLHNFVSFPKGGLPALKLTYFWGYGFLKLDSFSEGGLPSNLYSLQIGGCCEKLIAGWMDRHLQCLSSLTSFEIDGKFETVESFPDEGLLPSTLRHLSISKLSCLKTLDGRGLERLSSLKSLKIRECPNLQSMPVESLPTCLASLCIDKCPLLKERCQRDKGEDWPKIAHIPSIFFDSELI